jgi:hypothetical protein
MADRDDLICLHCISNEDLRDCIRDRAARGRCSFCENRRLCVSLWTLAARIHEVYQEHFAPGAEEKVFSLSDGDNGHYEQEGELPTNIMQDIAGVEPEVADAIVELLSANEWRNVRDGADPLYDASCCYVQRGLFPDEQEEM